MNRREFFAKSIELGLGCGSLHDRYEGHGSTSREGSKGGRHGAYSWFGCATTLSQHPPKYDGDVRDDLYKLVFRRQDQKK